MAEVRASELVIVVWCLVAAAVAMRRPIPTQRRRFVMAGALGMGVVVMALSHLPAGGPGAAVRNLAPAVWVLAAYWIASGFFVAPQRTLEAWLVRVDQRVLGPLRLESRLLRGPRWPLAALELAYLAVYAMLPIGVWAAWTTGGDAAVDWYWLVVFPAEASCYLALAWLQARPPRDLEPWVAEVRSRTRLRRVNEFVLQHGSHRMNTIPSGHAAGAVAVVLALTSMNAPAAVPLVMLAVAILLATVLGRYHFVVDTVAGALVAVVCWAVVRLLV